MSEEERKNAEEFERLEKLAETIDISTILPPVDMIGGLFPRKYVSVIISPPGVGKTWFMQKIVSDLSVGGKILGGFGYSEPRKSLIFAGEAGWEMLVRRGTDTRWPIRVDNVTVYSTIKLETEGLSLDIDTSDGRRRVEAIIKKHKPDIVFFDTLTAVHTSDENKAVEMKPIFIYLLTLAEKENLAVVPIHHTRKRKLVEQKYMMTQDEAVGSGVLNRLASVIIGIEAIGDGADEQRPNLVKAQKSWFRKFPPFTYKLDEDEDGKTIMVFDLEPKIGGGARVRIWEYIEQTYEIGAWFGASDILQGVGGGLSRQYALRCLTEWVQSGRLEKRGENRWTEYAVRLPP